MIKCSKTRGEYMSKSKINHRILRKEERSVDNNIYTYELIMREGDATASWRMPLYSVRVKMKDALGVSRTADAKDIFADGVKAVSFFERLVKNLATPIDLAYIVEDELCDI
jgi:hypothetical protein